MKDALGMNLMEEYVINQSEQVTEDLQKFCGCLEIEVGTNPALRERYILQGTYEYSNTL